MMLAWLSARGLFGLAKGWWLLIAAFGCFAIYIGIHGLLDRYGDASRDLGVQQQQNADLTATVKQVEKANAAAETVRRDPDAARAECLRNARNKADC